MLGTIFNYAIYRENELNTLELNILITAFDITVCIAISHYQKIIEIRISLTL